MAKFDVFRCCKRSRAVFSGGRPDCAAGSAEETEKDDFQPRAVVGARARFCHHSISRHHTEGETRCSHPAAREQNPGTEPSELHPMCCYIHQLLVLLLTKYAVNVTFK